MTQTQTHTAEAGDVTTHAWLREGATVYTLKCVERPHGRGPTMVNDNWFQVQGPDAEAVAERIHNALAASPAPRAPAAVSEEVLVKVRAMLDAEAAHEASEQAVTSARQALREAEGDDIERCAEARDAARQKRFETEAAVYRAVEAIRADLRTLAAGSTTPTAEGGMTTLREAIVGAGRAS